MKYTLYATSDHGNGYVQEVGTFNDLEAIQIHVGHFSKDVVISIGIELSSDIDIENELAIPPDEFITGKFLES